LNREFPLSPFPFVRTTDVDQAREAISRVYADGRLTPVGSGKSFSYYFNVAPLGTVTLTAMDWGGGMTFEAPSLDSCFRRYRSCTPIRFLKHVRLRRARDELLAAAPACSVTHVALKWGFLNLGRFSAEYRQQFGENPSKTLRRARRGARCSARLDEAAAPREGRAAYSGCTSFMQS
jgi:AraC-like DNA-binding protein